MNHLASAMTPEPRTYATADGLTLRGGAWTPEGPARAVVVFTHGLFEHHARFAPLAEAMSRRGYAFYGYDLRGHGRSDGERAWIESFAQYVTDLGVVVDAAGSEHPGLPVFLVGHSMGGAVTATYLVERPRDAAGAVFSAAAFRIGNRVSPLLRYIAGLLNRFWPRLRLTRVGVGGLSRDAAVRDDFMRDPLVCLGRFPVRIGAEVLKAARHVTDSRAKLAVPMLLLHGTADRITDAAGSVRIHADAPAADKTLRLYDGLYHDLFHEPERDEIVAETLAWLDARTKNPGG